MADRGPTSADHTRLATALNNMTREFRAMNDGMRALNTNLVALHEVMKEKQNDE